MRFHVPGLPHTLPTTAYLHCAYSQKIRLFAVMMRSLGHEVFVYESDTALPPESNLLCPFEPMHPLWMRQNARAIEAIRATAQPTDVLALIAGRCQQVIAQACPQLLAVEFGVGYDGIFADYCVFESYAHQANVYGQRGIRRGRNFDAVIPNYFDPADFPFRAEKDDYLLFIGRLNEDKGVQVAVDVARLAGRKLIICGQGEPPKAPHVEYRGLVGVAERGALMAGAHAILVPTLYLEPFGGVAVEAQMCGTPAITTDFGAFPETVEEGVTGFRCHYLGEFIEAVDQVGALDSTAIRARAERLYSIDQVRHRYQRYFERLALLWAEGWYARGAA